MAKKCGNRNWGKPDPYCSALPKTTAFEQVVKRLNLRPEEYIRSLRLRQWARKHKDSRYVPEALLEAWRF